MTLQRLQNLPLLTLVLTLAFASLGISGAHAQTYIDLHDFATPNLTSPQYPGILAQGRDGNLYGTAPVGGTTGHGGVFQISPGGAYSEIYNFSGGVLGANPYSGLTLGTDGNFYGTTFNNGAFIFGTVFQITPSGIVTILHSFSLIEGADPYAPPIQGTDGNFYGTTTIGGLGYGAVYKVSPTGAFTVLHQFDNTHGSTPIAPLIQGKDGNFYGTTKVGGTTGNGTVFKMTPAGTLTVLYNFDSTHGAQPYSPLVQGSDGNFYGTSRDGGTLNGGGVVFKLTPAKKLTVLYNFNATGSTPDGTRPYAGLIQASDGNFYGVTSAGGTNAAGTLYRITAAGSYSILYNFVPATGSLPFATLRQHTNGIFYGEATAGGATGHGALFSFDAGLAGVGSFLSLQPTSGVVSQPVGILGQGLTGTATVKFNGKSAAFTVVSDTYISTSVPFGAITGFVKTTGTSGNRTSNQKFQVTPAILSFSPTSGPVGTPVVITGTSFTGATKVTFGGKTAVKVVNSYTQITATVPAAAVTGNIQVTTPGGIATSPAVFTVN